MNLYPDKYDPAKDPDQYDPDNYFPPWVAGVVIIAILFVLGGLTCLVYAAVQHFF
jgi:hypothetical protein